MKYIIILLFVLGISLVGFNEAFADNSSNRFNHNVEYINVDYDRSTETFSINYSFDIEEQCAVKLYVNTRNSGGGWPLTAGSLYPKTFTFGDGQIITEDVNFGPYVINSATWIEIVPCNTTLTFPLSHVTLAGDTVMPSVVFYKVNDGATRYDLEDKITAVEFIHYTFVPNFIFCGHWVDKNLIIDPGLTYSTCNKFNSASTPIEKTTIPEISPFKTTPKIKSSLVFLTLQQPVQNPPTLTINGYLHNNPQGIEHTINFAQLHKTDDGKGAVFTDIVRYSPTTVNHTATVTNIILKTVGSYEIVSSNSIGDYSLDKSECIVNGVSGDITFVASDNDVIICDFYYNYDTSSAQLEAKNNGGNSDSNKDHIPPTLGMNSEHERVVDNGFTFNGNTINVDHEYTEFSLITTSVGQKNTLELVIYEERDMSLVHIGLGLENIRTAIQEAEAFIDYHFRPSNSLLEPLDVIDKDNILQNVSMKSIDHYKCNDEDIDHLDCIKMVFEYEYREAPKSNIIAVQLVDDNGNKFTHYFNHGIAVSGESLNGPVTVIVGGIEYTRTDKVNDIWESDGIEYKKISETLFDRITPWTEYVCNDTPLAQMKGGYGRDNCNFRALAIGVWK